MNDDIIMNKNNKSNYNYIFDEILAEDPMEYGILCSIKLCCHNILALLSTT